jgi:tetratricopeptide (TPR) repeat protein/predicted Ser/Thr protein kinase
VTHQTDRHFDRCKSAFLAVLEHPEPEREQALRTLCAADPAVERAVRTLLARHASARTPLDRTPVWQETLAPTSLLRVGPDEDRCETGAPPVRPGQTLGPYTIDAELGAGAMGLVFAARHRVTGQPAALKLIRPDASSARVRKRFTAEGRALARLRHPGIAQVFDAGVAQPDAHPDAPALPYIAMELVRGRPLTTASRDLPRADRLRLVEQAARAVHHAHLNGVVHRDLKPANVLVDDQNRVKILDFGVAKLTQPDPDLAVTTQAGQIVGTPAYMSPEQLGADPHGGGVDHRADVYALGVILFELLAGRRPIDTDTADGLWSVLRRVEQGPPRLASIDRTCRGDLDVITAVALRADPAERYQSAAELADDLARHLERRPIHARPRTRRYVLNRFVRRNPWPVALGTLAALAVGAGTAGVVIKERQAAAAEARATQRFDETRRLARTVLFELSDSIARLPGSTPARRLLAETAQTYLNRLAADPAADDDLLLELGEAYTRLGDILGLPFDNNLGDIDGALRNWERAVGILEPLAERHPENPRVLVAAGRAIHSHNALSGDGRVPEIAIPRSLRALELIERAAALAPDDPDIAAWLTQARYRIALEYYDAGVHDQRERLIVHAVETATGQLARWPHDREIRRAAIDAFFWQGYLRVDLRLPDARTPLERAGELCREALHADPADTAASYRLSSVHARLAIVAGRAGDAQTARDEIREALALSARLTAADPENQYFHRAHSVTLAMAGFARRELAEADPGRRDEHLRAALDLHRRAHAALEDRIARGWLWPWEAHYPAQSIERITECEQALAEATPDP